MVFLWVLYCPNVCNSLHYGLSDTNEGGLTRTSDSEPSFKELIYSYLGDWEREDSEDSIICFDLLLSINNPLDFA
jgi:hypothetical protein